MVIDPETGGGRRRRFATLLALLVCLTGAGAPSSDPDLALETRVATVGYRLAAGARARCPVPEVMAGMVLHDIGGYAQSDRPAIAKSPGLGDGFGIRALVPGGAAARAGLRAGDEIVALNGRDLTGFARDAIGRAGSFDRSERFTDLLAAALAPGPAELRVRRGDGDATVRLAGDPGCAARFAVAVERTPNARADGRYVAVTSGLAARAASDDALAFPIAHEMAHILLGHVAVRRAGAGAAVLRAQELAADDLALAIMADAGYAPRAAVPLLASLGGVLRIDRAHPPLSLRIARIEAALRVGGGTR